MLKYNAETELRLGPKCRPTEEEMFGTLTVPLGRKAIYGELSVETTRFSKEICEHVFTYGIRQILNDAIAQKDGLSKSELFEKAKLRLENLYAGVLRKVREEKSIDSIEEMVFARIKETLTLKWKAKGFWVSEGQNRFLRTANEIQKSAGKEAFDSEQEYLSAAAKANPKIVARFRKEIENSLSEDLGVEI